MNFTEPVSQSGKFWYRMLQWPEGRQGHVFLAAAVLEVGAAYFGNQWGNFEGFVTRGTIELPRKVLHFEQLMSDEDKMRNQVVYAAQQRFKKAKSIVVSALAEGQLRFALRPLKGGSYISQPRDPRDPGLGAEVWNLDEYEHRFDFCRMELSDPYSVRPDGEYFIFITRTSLDDFKSSLTQKTAPPTESEIEQRTSNMSRLYLSEYLHTMLYTCSRLSVSPDKLPTVEAMKAEIEQSWKHLYPQAVLSNKLRDAMATLCRDQGSQLGRAKPRQPSEPGVNGNGIPPFKCITFSGL
jgi:hypothetical protein